MQTYEGWQIFPHHKLQFNPVAQEVRLSEPSGAVLDFSISGGETVLAAPPYAISNFGGGEPSGRSDPRNTRIFHQEDQIVVHASDGSQRFYLKRVVR